MKLYIHISRTADRETVIDREHEIAEAEECQRHVKEAYDDLNRMNLTLFDCTVSIHSVRTAAQAA